MQATSYIRCFALMALVLAGFSCKGKQPMVQTKEKERHPVVGSAKLAPTLIYKTTKDYSGNVPVIMNDEKTNIVSYPDPSDIYYGGVLAKPTSLVDGYQLDNRGIGPNVAFLDYTYEAYAALKNAPDKNGLFVHLIDKQPLLELWDCGPRKDTSDEVSRLNRLIKKGFPGCKQLITIQRVIFEK